MKVLLSNIPWNAKGKTGVRAGSRWPHLKNVSTEKEYLPFPFFLAYTSALLKKNGINVILIDAIAEELSDREFFDEVKKIRPDLLISEVSTPSLRQDLEILKHISPDVKKVVCGPEVHIRSPEFLKKYSFIDYVIVGEYEYTVFDLVRQLEQEGNLKKIPGLIYSENKNIIVNQSRSLCNIDSLPWPAREELPMHKYWDLPGNIPYPSAQMLSSRGCPFKCNFCLWPQVMYGANEYRARDPVDVVDEMEFLIREKRFKSIYFDDDTFNIGKQRILRICDEIKKRGLQNIPWAVMARADLMDEEMLREMKSSGLYSVKYGIESGVQRLIDNCGKNMDLQKTKRMIKFTKKLGVKIHLTFTFGLPGETKNTINKTIYTALELEPESVQFSINTPYPGTKYFKDLDKKNQVVTKQWDKYDGNYGSVIETDNLSSDDLKRAKQKAYRIWGKHLEKRRFSIHGIYYRIKKYMLNNNFFVFLKKM